MTARLPQSVDLSGLGARWDHVRAAAQRVDVACYLAVAQLPESALDVPLRRLSAAANYSRISMATAAALALVGGPRGRRTAVVGMAAVGATSALVNLAGKLLTDRPRPDRPTHGVPKSRQVPMPHSSSFPSGHTAAAFAFATAVIHEWRPASVVVLPLAGAVGFSRVFVGVHYPGDVAAGALIGIVVGRLVIRVADHKVRANLA